MKEVPPLPARLTIAVVAVLTGALTVLMPYCGCLLGLPGIIGGWFGLRKVCRHHRQLEYREGAWLAFYGAVIGTMVALTCCFFASDIFDLEKIRVALAENMEGFREGLVTGGTDPATIESQMALLEVTSGVTMAVAPWVPLFILFLNGLGGVGGGLLAVLQSRKKR